MTSDEFRTFTRESLDQMRERRKACESEWALSRYRVTDLHEADSTLRFSEGPGDDLVCRVQIVGSYATAEQLWRWSWDNESISKPLKVDLLDVKSFGEEHKIPPLTTGVWKSDSEEIAWGMTALSAKILDSNCVHQGPLAGLNVYMLLNDLRVV